MLFSDISPLMGYLSPFFSFALYSGYFLLFCSKFFVYFLGVKFWRLLIHLHVAAWLLLKHFFSFFSSCKTWLMTNLKIFKDTSFCWYSSFKTTPDIPYSSRGTRLFTFGVGFLILSFDQFCCSSDILSICSLISSYVLFWVESNKIRTKKPLVYNIL